MILTLTASIMYWSLQKQGPYQSPGPQDTLPEEEECEEEEEEEDFEGGVEDGVSETTT
jgi:plastin-1